MKAKKLLALFLTALMALTILTACGGGGGGISGAKSLSALDNALEAAADAASQSSWDKEQSLTLAATEFARHMIDGDLEGMECGFFYVAANSELEAPVSSYLAGGLYTLRRERPGATFYTGSAKGTTTDGVNFWVMAIMTE